MSGSYIVIGIHGLANKPEKALLETWWRSAIQEGLARNEGRTSGDIEFELVYWRDWRYPQAITEEENDEPYTEAEGEGPLPAYNQQFWDILRAEALDWVDTPLDWMKHFFGVGTIADVVLQAKLQDLALYYQDPSKREKLRVRLEETILRHKGKRILIAAHSMGSIVAYDVLRRLGRRDPELRIQHFITIGSPLGLPHVKYRVWQENDLVRTPSIVERWTNFSDRRDPVAADTHLYDDYQPNDKGTRVQDDLVINGYLRPDGNPNFHKSYGYLRTPELSKLLRGFI